MSGSLFSKHRMLLMDSSETGTPVSIFAHSLRDRPIENWEPLSHHLTAVGNRAAEFADAFGRKEAARVAGVCTTSINALAARTAWRNTAAEGSGRRLLDRGLD